MTDTHSKVRQDAELAFGNAQSQFFARGQAFEELDAIVHARGEKTLRLREARLAKEAANLTIELKPAAKKRISRKINA